VKQALVETMMAAETTAGRQAGVCRQGTAIREASFLYLTLCFSPRWDDVLANKIRATLCFTTSVFFLAW